MSSFVDLLSCNIMERDSNGDVLWTWTFPSVTEQQQSLIMRKCGLDGDHVSLQPFVYGRNGKMWYYINCTEVFDSDNLPKVKQFALVLWSQDFNAEKYETLCRILSKTYCKTGNPAVVLQLYLSVVTKGSCTTEENGTFVSKDFDGRKFSANTKLKGRRVNLEQAEPDHGGGRTLEQPPPLLPVSAEPLTPQNTVLEKHGPKECTWVRTFPAMMWHRQHNEILFPWIDIVAEELVDLKSNSHYVAGCRDSAIGSRTDLYDLLVNLPAREITVAPHAKESMTMTKTHKDIAVFMVQLVERESIQEQQIIKEISEKTKELLSQLTSLATVTTAEGKKMVSIETLRERNLPQALDNFLFNLAVAENMMML